MARRKALPLDGPNWLPIHGVLGTLCQVTGNRRLAARDLRKAMADRRGVPSMWRCVASGRNPDGEAVPLGPDRELLPPAFWDKHELDVWSDRTFVRCCYGCDRKHQNIDYFEFFVWKPALGKTWPTVFAPTADAIDDRLRRKPGSRPKDEWPLLVAAKLIYLARYDPEALENVEALIKPMQEFLQAEIGWHPKDRKQVREKIVFLLQLVRQ
jgi:hypothetical protein